MQVIAGPDGYVATTEAADYPFQVILTEHLSDRKTTGDGALERVLPKLRKTLGKKDLVALIRAIHERIGWHAAHEAELAHGPRWQVCLAQLARNLYAPALPFAEADLIALLESHRKHSSLWSFGPEELLGAYLEPNDLSPALAGELRRYQADLIGSPGGMKFQSQASYQSAVQQVHMLLWWDESDALNAAECWSDRVRADFRAMTGDRRARWRGALGHIKANSSAKPSPAWLKGAAQHLAGLGADEFRDRFVAWFQPFAGDEPQRLSVAGSHVLRGLLWYAGVARDAALAGPALALLDTRWKAKRNVDKAMVALTAVLETLPEVEAWPSLLRLQTEWPTTSGQVERLVKKMATDRGMSEEELRRQEVLKPPHDPKAHAEKIMRRLNETGLILRRRNPQEH